jgi:hypothetical protein
LRATLTDVEDRIGALGGSLRVVDMGTRTHVDAAIPVRGTAVDHIDALGPGR